MFPNVRCTCFFLYLILSFADLRVLVIGEQQTEPVKDVKAVTPPIEFPNNESKYPFSHNPVMLRTLVSQTSNNNTEVDDLRRGGQFFNMTHRHQITLPPKETENSTAKSVDPKLQIEEIEDGQDTEENLRRRTNATINTTNPNNNKTMYNANKREPSYGSRMPLIQGQLAAILAGTFVAIAVIGYIGMLSWRRFLETRYGNREMLVNEEDFYDPNDMRHFSL